MRSLRPSTALRPRQALRLSAAALPLALAVLSGCASSKGAVVTAPRDFPGYPPRSTDGVLWAEAVFYENHEEVFFADLTDEDVVPIAVQVGLRGRGEDILRLSEDDLDAHLYLQDGTALSWVLPDRLKPDGRRARDRVAELGLPLTFLRQWEDAPLGFLFFRFDDDVVTIQDDKALVRHGDSVRELDLAHSVIALHVSGPEGPRELFVGLRYSHWADSR